MTVDEVGDFAEEGSQPHEEMDAGTTEGISVSSPNTAAQSEDTTAPEEEVEGERGESRVPCAGVYENRIEENVEDHTQVIIIFFF